MKPSFEREGATAQIKTALSAIVFIVISCLLALLVHMVWPSGEEARAVEPTQTSGWQQSGASNPFGKAGQAPASQTPLTAAPQKPTTTQATLLLANTSLAGTQPDGDWAVAANGQALANRALRQRFDYYFSLIGEVPLADLRVLVLRDARQSLSEPALGTVMALWDKYVQLQQHAWKHEVDLRQPSTWSAALIERQIVRRQTLGAEAANAFYAEEESALQNMIARVNSGAGAAQAAAADTEPVVTPALHPQAQEREAQLQAKWQAWDARLAAARRQVLAYNQAPELSAPQRSQAIEIYLNQQFQGSDLIRARSLLGL